MTHRAAEDASLIRRFVAGDHTAFEPLMAAHEDRVFGICLRMLRDRDAALDAVQETFLTVFRKADRYKEQAAFSTWLYRVAVNTLPIPRATTPSSRRRYDPISSTPCRPSPPSFGRP